MRQAILAMLVIGSALAFGLPAAAGGGGCHEFTEGTTTEVNLDNNCFGPTVARVPVGTTITWTNTDSWEHNVYSPAFADSGILAPGDRYSFTFDEPGVYPYVCTLHPGMMGTVVVGDVGHVETIAEPTSFGIPAIGGVGILIIGLLGGWAFTRRATRREPIDS